MNQEEQQEPGPYEFEREVKTSSRVRATLIATAAALVAGGIVAGAAYALNASPQPSASETSEEQLGPAPSYSNEPVEAAEDSPKPEQHTVVVPPVAVKPNHKPKPGAGSTPLPGATKKPHFGNSHEDDNDEHEDSDD